MSGRRIRLDLSDFVLDIGSHRWMFLSDLKFSTVSDLVEQLKEEYTWVAHSPPFVLNLFRTVFIG